MLTYLFVYLYKKNNPSFFNLYNLYNNFIYNYIYNFIILLIKIILSLFILFYKNLLLELNNMYSKYLDYTETAVRAHQAAQIENDQKDILIGQLKS